MNNIKLSLVVSELAMKHEKSYMDLGLHADEL